MTAPRIIVDLVERFDRNRDAYRAGHYNETQLRREFIDPFFKALGWDIDNEQGNAENYKDVIHEDAIKIGSATKAPDYCFRIGGFRKFFLEAKKPSIDIKGDPGPAYQLRRYAWSAKLPLSILTDFEEFAVYDCRVRPVLTDKSSAARILYLKYTDYAEKWDEIVSIFSKDAVLKGSFDKYAESSRLKKGTAQVDDAFLAEIESWRDELAHNIALRNPKLSSRQLNFAVQMTVDRIIFLRICEDRGVERYGELMALLNGTDIYQRLLVLFRKADDRYNSGLFHFSKEKDRPEDPDELTPTLVIDDKVLKDIFRGLYYPESPYAFSVLPTEILGQVYEQFLGRVITLTAGHHAKVEEKPEVKKAGGVFYTPSYIVDYIVQNTVGKLVEGKTPKDVEKIKILDPACGSGSFLLGAYQFLLNWHLDWYLANDPAKWAKSKNSPICQTTPVIPATCPYRRGKAGIQPSANFKLTLNERKHILLNNIFGVDIDSQAVEVTKLSLLLKVLEGEKQLIYFHRALPDLALNIKCGNSLIGPDFYHNQQMMMFDDEQKYKINAFDWQAEFKDIFTRKNPGFDAVIGNPPYGVPFNKVSQEYLKSNYECFVWRGESYLIFIEKALSLLCRNGLFGYIIPDTYLNLTFTYPLRKMLLNFTRLSEIVLLPSKVFSDAAVDTTLLFYQKIEDSSDYTINIKLFQKNSKITSLSEPYRSYNIRSALWKKEGSFLVTSSPDEINLISKMESSRKKISDYAEIFYGIKTYQVGKGNPPQTENIRDTKPFTSNKKLSKEFSPFFEGKHIGRYSLLWNNNNWVKYGPWVAEPRKPEKYQGEKILIRKIVGRTLIATFYPDTSYCNTLLYVLKLHNYIQYFYSYLLGILNSRLIGWYYRHKYQISDSDTFPQIMIKDILSFPLPAATDKVEKEWSSLVETMLDLHKKLAAAKTPNEKTVLQRQITATDAQIDRLVYELYGLTAEEIKLVEEAGK
jgi:hypothetical protein